MKRLAWGILGSLAIAALLFGAATTWGDFIAIPRGTAAGETGRVRFRELAANGQHSVDLKAPDSLAATTAYTLPNAPPAANGYSLTGNTNGTTQWSNITSGGGGGWSLLETETASSSSTLVFTSFSATYDIYKMTFQGIRTSGDGTSGRLGLQVSTDGGSSWDTSANYEWAALAWAYNGAGGNGPGSASEVGVFVNENTTTADYTLNGELTIFNPNDSGNFRFFTGTWVGRPSAGDGRLLGWGSAIRWLNNTDAYSAIRICQGNGTACSGTIDSGTVRLYGISK